MMYPFMTLYDGTEIVHSQTLADGRVKVYMEKPDARDGFHHATCYLPDCGAMRSSKSGGRISVKRAFSADFCKHADEKYPYDNATATIGQTACRQICSGCVIIHTKS